MSTHMHDLFLSLNWIWLIISEIAEKSAWAVMGAKAVLLRSRDVTVE